MNTQSDLTTYQSAEFFTIRVHNYKDDLGHDHVSLHGLFTDRDEAERIARAVSVAWDFITADVLPIQSSAIANIAAAQRISHIEPDLPAEFEQDSQAASVAVPDDNTIVSASGFADMTYRVASRTPGHPSNPHPVGSYLNPTRESIADEVAGEAAVMESLRAEQTASQASETPTERDPVADATALAPVVHEADWMMAGPRWPWHQATAQQRQDAFLIAQHAIADPTMDDEALVVLVEQFWSNKPKHGAPRRVAAKASKIREWLINEGLRERSDRPSGRS